MDTRRPRIMLTILGPHRRGRNGGRVPFRSRLRAFKWRLRFSTDCSARFHRVVAKSRTIRRASRRDLCATTRALASGLWREPDADACRLIEVAQFSTNHEIWFSRQVSHSARASVLDISRLSTRATRAETNQRGLPRALCVFAVASRRSFCSHRFALLLIDDGLRSFAAYDKQSQQAQGSQRDCRGLGDSDQADHVRASHAVVKDRHNV